MILSGTGYGVHGPDSSFSLGSRLTVHVWSRGSLFSCRVLFVAVRRRGICSQNISDQNIFSFYKFKNYNPC